MNIPRTLSFLTVEKPGVPVEHRFFLYVAGYAVLTVMFCRIAVAQDISLISPTKTLSDIESAIENRKVGSLEILHMPDRIETLASVTPENLERWFESRVEIMKVNEWGGREDLLRILRATRLAPASRMVDMRSAIVFNGLDGKRIGTLYVGRFFGRYIGQFGGADGAIGNTPVKFEGNLSAWLKEMIPSPLR